MIIILLDLIQCVVAVLFFMPVVLYLLDFLVLKLTTGVNWTIHLWLGTTFVAGIAGFLLSFLLVPAEIPEKVVDE